MRHQRRTRNLYWAENVEPRLVLSFVMPTVDPATHDGEHAHNEDLKSADARFNAGPAIRLDLVALHEFGHSLGLDHSTDPTSIMFAYYNANYDLTQFANDSAVTTLRSLFANVNTSSWKDSLDPLPGNGVVDVTYSWVPDGTRMDKRTSSNMFATFNSLYGNSSVWTQIFTTQLDRWESVSNGKLNFVSHTDSGMPFNYAGSVQNDANSGDIRIGTHRIDVKGNVLAHTYFPPPNGITAAGDAHFDSLENWDGKRGGSTSTITTTRTSRGTLVLGEMNDSSPTNDMDVEGTIVNAIRKSADTVEDVRSALVVSQLATKKKQFSTASTESSHTRRDVDKQIDGTENDSLAIGDQQALDVLFRSHTLIEQLRITSPSLSRN